MAFQSKLAELIIRLKWLIIIIVVALSLFFGYGLRYITINPDIISSLPDGDQVAHLYKQIGNEFGGNDMGIIVLETDDVFTSEVLEGIRQITDSIQFTQGISYVTSMTNIMNITSSEWGIEIGKLVDEYDLPSEQKELDELRDYVMSKEMYKGTIISDDGKATAIMFTLQPEGDKQSVAREIKTKIEEMKLPWKLYFGGLPLMMNDVNDLILNDIIWLIPVVFIFIAGVLILSFQSLRGLLMPLLAAGIAILWTIGIMAYIGYELTIVTNITPVVLVAVGSAYAIHVVNSINNSKTGDKKKTIVKALTYIIVPVILASSTTIVGFISFVFGSYLLMIRDFGVFSALGTAIALLLSIFFVPALIAAFGKEQKIKSTTKKESKNTLIDRLLMPLVHFVFNHPVRTLSIWGGVLIICIWGIFQIKTSINIVDYFKKNNPTRITENIMQEKFGGTMPIFLVFEGDIQEPEILKMMMKTETYMKTDPNITIAQSVADLIEQMNDAMGEGLAIPDEKEKIEQLWFLLDGQEIMEQLVNDDLSKGIIQAKFASIDSDEMETFIKKMEVFINENQSDNYKMSITGMPSIYVRLNESLIKSQYTSLLIAIAMVVLIVGSILKSLKKGVITAIPVVTTVIILLGFMGITGITLDIATVLVASIVMGIGIDYSIHIMTGFNNFIIAGEGVDSAIEKVLFFSGKAVVINVLSVSSGFIVLLFSQLVPLQNFGLLIAVSMIGSGLGALTILPAILILANRKKNSINNK